MPFNTATFIVFLTVVLLAYHALRDWTARKSLLLVASYLFYGAWNPAFTLLLLFSTVVDWWLARAIAGTELPRRRRGFLIASLTTNLGLLGYFKYGDFLLANSVTLLAMAGVNYRPPALDILLPVGISFYTFQTLSYTIDVYRRRITTEPSFLNYALYVAFFPQLVAGPIVRAGKFLPQCQTPRDTGMDRLGWGLALIVTGLFMKMVLADQILAPVVDRVYALPDLASRIETWTAVLAFSGQIYCDFAGYTTCAIGTALCFGMVLPDNFRAPYAALGPADFWRRWHISLSTWLRDYLYIPLGGNRITPSRTDINLMLTMLLGGLWHGASWMFVIWGGLHGLYLVIERRLTRFAGGFAPSPLTRYLLILMTWLLISLTWIFFRAPDSGVARTLFGNLLSVKSTLVLTNAELQLALLTSLGLFGWQVWRRESTLEHVYHRLATPLRAALLAILSLIVLLTGSGDDRAFIYFQF